MSAALSILEEAIPILRQRHLLFSTRPESRSRVDCMPTRTSALSCTFLTYLPASGQVDGEETVQLLQRELRYLPESVKRKDHNYRTPETTLTSQAATTSKIPAKGTDYIYGERAVTLEEAEQLARRRQLVHDCQRETN